MIISENQKGLLLLSMTSAILTGIVSSIGIINPKIYLPMTPQEMLPGAVSQDIISLVAAMGLLAAILAIKKGFNRAWLIWLGFSGYLLYAYAIYSFDRVYNNFFLLYVAIFGLSVYIIIIFFKNADLACFEGTVKRSLPRKIVGAYFIILVLMFFMVWMSQILPGIQKHEPPVGNSIFVLDLSFFLPLLTIGAVLLLKKKPFGDFLAAILLIKIGTLGFSVFLGELLRPFFQQELDPPMIALFAFLGLGALFFAVIFLHRLGRLEEAKYSN